MGARGLSTNDSELAIDPAFKDGGLQPPTNGATNWLISNEVLLVILSRSQVELGNVIVPEAKLHIPRCLLRAPPIRRSALDVRPNS